MYITLLDSLVKIARYAPNGKLLAVAGKAHTSFEPYWFVHMYDSQTLTLQLKREMSFEITCLSWSPDSTLLAYGGKEGVVVIWDFGTDRSTLTYNGHSPEVNRLPLLCQPQRRELYTLTWVSDHQLLSVGADSCLRLWSVPSGSTVRCFSLGLVSHCQQFSPDGSLLALYKPHRWLDDACEQAAVLLYRTATGECAATLPYHDIRTLAWHPQDRQLAICEREHLTVWDISVLETPVRTGSFPYHPVHRRSGLPPLSALAWSPAGTYLACSIEWTTHIRGKHSWEDQYHKHCGVRVIDRSTGGDRHIEVPYEPHCLDWSPDGMQLVVGGLERVDLLPVNTVIDEASEDTSCRLCE